MPSVGMPAATLPSSSDNALSPPKEPVPAWVRASSAARSRTSAVSSSSRHGGATTSLGRAFAESGSERWSATEKQRSSETSSPQNSMRTGDSAVGGNRSTIPPRTANSPRFSTISTRA